MSEHGKSAMANLLNESCSPYVLHHPLRPVTAPGGGRTLGDKPYARYAARIITGSSLPREGKIPLTSRPEAWLVMGCSKLAGALSRPLRRASGFPLDSNDGNGSFP